MERIKKFLTGPQDSVFSAASIIGVMIIASRILGLVRQRTLAHFFVPNELSLFFAAFRLPDLVFEVLVFGAFSSAFIPVFTKAVHKGNRGAWEIAGRVVNIGLLIFGFFAILFGIFAPSIYKIVAPGFSLEETGEIAYLARILFAAQGFFIISYVLTGVLESLKRFFIPAIAPLFYNLGIIITTLFLAPKLGLLAPTLGVVVGAFLHFLIQVPLAFGLGFRFIPSLKVTDEVKEIGELSGPRLVDLSFEQVEKTIELYLSSIISKASYTYFTLATSVQILPVNLFGTSLAKAALPTLSREVDNPEQFKKTFFNTLYLILFLVSPIATSVIVLRVPIVRLIFGTKIFDWEATVQTGLVLSAFGIGIIFEAIVALLERAFYALHETKTPVAISLVSIFLMIVAHLILVLGFHLPVWALAASFSGSVVLQSILLLYLLNKKLNLGSFLGILAPTFKIFISAFFSGAVMYFVLKFFDRAVWVKRLSFLSRVDIALPFEKFVIDTRYTGNLIILTTIVFALGLLIYVTLSVIFKSEQLAYLFAYGSRFVKTKILLPAKEEEPLTPSDSDLT